MDPDIPKASEANKNGGSAPKRRRCRMRPFEWLSILFDLVLAGATVTYAYYARGQLDAMTKQLTAIQAQAEAAKTQAGAGTAQATAAKEAARAATKSNRFARDALEIAHRAWLAVKIEPLRTIGPNKVHTVTVWVRNTGHVPADTVYIAVFAARYPATTVVCHDKLVLSQEGGSRADIAPGAKSMMKVPLGPYSAGVVRALKGPARGEILYILGRARYGNGFGHPGETRFCSLWDPGTGNFVVHHDFNSMR